MQPSLQQLLEILIRKPSITPHDAGCQEWMMAYLQNLGFTCEAFDNPPVSNFFARLGTKAPLLVFAGHTDVVTPGDDSLWHTPPFALKEQDGRIFGRGVADMKGSLAAMLDMVARFIKHHPDFSGSIGFLITSGEEGDHFELGTPYVMQELAKKNIHIDYCIVGEPSSTKEVGDTIKIGRRGSLTGKLYLQGKQGHVAYPHLAINPIHILAPVLLRLTTQEWDKGNTYFPPTSLQITHIQSGEGSNIIPGDVRLQLNFRFSTEQTAESLQKSVMAIFQTENIAPLLEWKLSGEPFLTQKGVLLQSTIQAIEEITHISPELSTSGGTSDGRFIAPFGVEVIELGLSNQTIHQHNEAICYQDLYTLAAMYYRICEIVLVCVDNPSTALP